MPNPRAQKPLSYDQIVKDAKSLGVPAQALLDALAGGLKGSVSATVGAPADIYNLINQASFRGQLPNLPYGSEDISKMLPDVIPTEDKSRQHTAEVGELAGSFIPTPMAGQAVKGALKLGKAGVKAFGEGLGQLAPSGSGPQTLASQVGAIKIKGGNWFANEVENNLKGLKSENRQISPSLFEGFEQSAKDPTDPLQERSIRRLREHNDELALNNWVDKNLTNYVKKEMGTPEDPVRLMIDKRVEEIKQKHKDDLARADKVAQRATEETDPRRQANLQREANRLRTEADSDRELGLKHIAHFQVIDPEYLTPKDVKEVLGKLREEAGFPAKGMGKSAQAKGYENFADNAIYSKQAGQLQEIPERLAQVKQANVERIKAQEELDKKFAQHLRDSPANLTEEQIQHLTQKMGFDDKEQLIGDDTYSKAWAKHRNLESWDDDINSKRLQQNPYINKLTPETNIYSAQTGNLEFSHILDVLKEDLASGRLKPEDLKNISVEQAVRKTADYDLALAKKMQEAQAKKLEDMTVHKEYPEGMRWVQLDKPGQFASESQAMGHSVRGYEPPQGHPDWIPESGDSGSDYYGHGGWEAIKNGEAKVYSLVDPKGNPHTTIEVKAPSIDEHTDANMSNPYRPALDKITQIKGKSNLSPDKKYLPFIQDFVKSGNWSDVGDIKNTGLTKKTDIYDWDLLTPEQQNLMHEIEPSEYITPEAYKIFEERKASLNPQPPVEGMKKGGAVTISDNPDTMFMELMDKKMKDGGAEADTKASFGVFPQLKPYRDNQDPEASKDMPLQALRGRVAGTLGLPSDLVNLPLRLVNALADTDYQVPYGTEHWQKTLPLKPTSPAGEASSEAGSFFPSSAVLKAELQGLKHLGKMAGSELGRRAITGESFTPLLNTAMPMTHVVKPEKGGNWLAGNVEKTLENLKQSDLLNNVKYFHGPEFEKAREARIKQLKESGSEGALRVVKHLEDNRESDKAKGFLNQWVDKNLTNYVKKEMGTPEDPIRKLAEQGIVHVPSERVGINRYRAPQHRETFGGEQLGKSEEAKAWEDASDVAINAPRARNIKENESLYRENPWVEKLANEDRVYALNNPASYRSEFSGLGFDHIIDVLKQDIANGRLRPESLKNVSVEQAVRRAYEYDQDMAKKMAEAQIKNTEGMPIHKEYPEGYKWIELAKPDIKELPQGHQIKYTSQNTPYLVDSNGNNVGYLQEGKEHEQALSKIAEDKLAEALKYEGETMGHCVGGYCPDVLEGRSRIFSLRDAKGEPHVTVEAQPNFPTWSMVENILGKEKAQELFKEFNTINPEYGSKSTAQIADIFNQFLKTKDLEPIDYGSKIVQIKGKQNLAPKEQYLPFVQDFVRSGNYSDVGDLQNTGLFDVNTNTEYARHLRLFADKVGLKLPNYLTNQEADILGRHSVNHRLAESAYPESKPIPELPEELKQYQIQPEPRVEGMKKGGVVTISDNPDTMYMEVMDKKMAGGGAVTKTLEKMLEEAPEMAHVIRGLFKSESPELSNLVDKLKTPERQPVLPMPNRWFTKPEDNPQVQPLVEKVLSANNMSRDQFHSGAFVDPRTGKILDKEIHKDVGVAIDPITNRPVMTSGGLSGYEALPVDMGSMTNSNLLKQGKYFPVGGDPILNDIGFLATIEKSGMGHKYGLGTEYATPAMLRNTMGGDNPTLRPRSVGDVFGMGDVIGQIKTTSKGPVHDVYEKLFVAPKGSDVKGVKLNKAKGGAIGTFDNEADTKLTPSQWLQAQANKPSEPWHPIDELTANLKGIATAPARLFEGAQKLVADPKAYFADMKAPTAEELAMAFNPSHIGMVGMAEKVGNLKAIDALFPNKTESMLTPAEKTALTKYKKDLDVPAVMRRELFRTTGTGDIETPSLKMRPEKGLSPDFLENKYVVPILWDTSGAGTNVSQIAGVPLTKGLRDATPTSTQKQGGRLYPLIEENAQQGVGGASMVGAASSKINNLNKYSDLGPTVGVIMDMAEHGIDFSHHIAEPYVGMLNALRPSNDALKAFRDAVRQSYVTDPNTKERTYPYTKFPGIDSPNIRDIMKYGTDDYTGGNIRKAIAEVGDTYAMEKLGFPKWSDIYQAMSMPDAKTGQSGKTILEVNPNAKIVTPNFEHGSYNTGMPANYAGGLADVNGNIVGVPDTVLLKKLFDERLAQGKSIGNVRSSLFKSHHGQLMTAEDIARLREYLGYDKPKKKAKGGAIKKAKGGKISNNPDAMFIKLHDRKFAGGGEVDVPSMEYEKEPVPINFFKHGNKMMAGNADVSTGGMGISSNINNDNLNLSLNSSDINKYGGERQLMNALMANYGHKVGDTNLTANVMSPLGVPVKNINLMASTPLGEGTASVGAHGSHGFGEKKLNGLSFNYNYPLEHGSLNANISRSLPDKKNTVNLNYVLPLKDGGSVNKKRK